MGKTDETKEELARLVDDLSDKPAGLEQLQGKMVVSAHQWQNTFDAIGDAVCLLNVKHQILRCNKAMGTSFNKRPDEMIVFPNLDADGVLIGAVHIIADVTEHKQAEAALRESEEKHTTLVERSNDGIIVIQGGLLKFLNSKMAQMAGYEQDELIDKPFIEFVAPSHRETVIDRYQKRMAGIKVPSEYEIAITRKDGTEVAVEINASLTEYEGTPADMAIVRDITERKRVEEALKKSEKRFRDICDNMADWVWETDADGECTYASGKTERIMSYKAEELLGKTPFDFMPEDEAVRVLEIFKKIVSNKEPIVDLENRNIRKNGDTIYILTNGTPLLNENGVLVGYRGVNKDITERKLAEEKLQEYAENLEQKVEDRTKELKEAQEKLIQSEKLAVVGQLSSGIAHELRNPLGIINNASYYLNSQYGEKDEKLSKFLKMIETQVFRSSAVIDGLLDYASNRSPSFEEVNLNTIITEVTDPAIIPANIALTVDIKKLPKITVDPRQITIVFYNIVINAIQAMQNGGSLTISGSKTGEFIEVQIKDTGAGIDAAHIDKVFDPMFTTKSDMGGIGIGLAICKIIIDNHAGTIDVQSEPGAGTTFTVKLPANQA